MFRIVEVGARKPATREFSREPFYSLPGAEVLSFEADAEEAARLKAIAPAHIKVLPVALGRANERRPFYITQNPKCCSLYEPNAELIGALDLQAARLVRTIEIETQTLDSVLDEQGWDGFDFIKADVQGAELDIVLGGARSFRAASAAVLEVCFRPIYRNQPLFGDLCSEMESIGMEFHHFVQLGGINDRTLWGDVLFVRTGASAAEMFLNMYPVPRARRSIKTVARSALKRLRLR